MGPFSLALVHLVQAHAMAATGVGGGAPVAAPGRLTRPTAQTNMGFHPAALLSANSPTLWTIARDSPLLKSLRFLERHLPSPAASPAEVEAAEVGATILAALSYNNLQPADAQALVDANPVEDYVDRVAANAVLHEWNEARIFETTYDSVHELAQAVHSSSLVDTTINGFRAAMVAHGAPFDAPAVPGRAAVRGRGAAPAVAAIPPVPGPPELACWRRITWGALIIEGRKMDPENPGMLLSMAFGLTSSCERDATRRSDSSRVRLTVGSIVYGASEAMRLGTTPTDAMLAANIPRYFARLLSVMPVVLRADGRSHAEAEAEVRDAHVILLGRDAEIQSVMWTRIYARLDKWDVLANFHGKLAAVSEARFIVEQLSTRFVSGGAALAPVVQVAELNRALKEAKKTEVISDLFAAGSTAHEVCDELLGQRELAAAGGASFASSSAEGPADSSGLGPATGGGSAISAAALERAMNADFKSTVEDADGLEGLELLDVISATNSVLLLRFLYFATPFLLPKHRIFGGMAKALPNRADFLSECVTTDPSTGKVPDPKATYRVGETINKKFWALEWDSLDMVNHDSTDHAIGGCLAERYLETGCPYSRIPLEQHYVTESTLLGIKPWFEKLHLAGGGSISPAKGYTWSQVVEKQLTAVRYTEGLPPSERTVWKRWLYDNFVTHALKRACTFAGGVLRSVEPADEEYGAFLPTDSPFFSNIDRKIADAAPVVVVRRAFPTLMPATPVQLAGTSSGQGGGGSGGGSGGGAGDGGGDSGGGKKGGKGKRPVGGEAKPTSLAKMLASGDLFLANRVYDVKGAATQLGIDVDSKDWAVLFSTKDGKDKLSVCLNPKQHGGIGSSYHTGVKGFNRAKFAEKYSREATEAERKEAGWSSHKKSKK